MWAVFADDQFITRWPSADEAETHAVDLLESGKAFKVVIYTPEAEYFVEGPDNVVRH
jgi:hypothetical protein